MTLKPEHELHRRRRGRNIGLLVVLICFAALIFALSIVKISNGSMMEGFDHQPRTSLLPREPDTQPTPGTAPAAAGTDQTGEEGQ